MQPLGKTASHLRLLARMAQVTQTDLVGTYRDGTLSQERWADLVQKFRSCVWADRCADWLDQQSQSAEAPPACLNRKRFKELRTSAAREP